MRIWVIAGAAVAGAIAVGAFGWTMYRAGGAAEREAVLKKAIESVKEMEKDNVQIKKLTDPGICREFGYEWLPEQGECG